MRDRQTNAPIVVAMLAMSVAVGVGAAMQPAAVGFFTRIGPVDSQTHVVPAVANDTFALLAATQTLTGKTYDAEATGNVLTTVSKYDFKAAACNNATATTTWDLPTAGAPTVSCNTGSNTQKGTLDYTDDGATVIQAQNSLWLPADFTGTIDVRLRWFTAATSGNAVWQVATTCIADAETSDPAYSTASTVTDAAKGTTLQDNDAAITGLTITTCAAGELMYVKVFRDPAHASDTLSATASLRHLELTVRRAQ